MVRMSFRVNNKKRPRPSSFRVPHEARGRGCEEQVSWARFGRGRPFEDRWFLEGFFCFWT